ncbi:hypothetical protein LTR27_005287 [Elasticomyces elasticus]|nr:hypothetical protein LTR27_005287 [Elasticomyces elasticus]
MLPVDQVLTADVNNAAQSGFEAGVQLVRQQTVMAVLAAQNYFVFLNTHRDADSVVIDKDIVLKLDDPSKPYGFDLSAFYSNVQACNNGQPDTSLDITDDLPPCALGIPFVTASQSICDAQGSFPSNLQLPCQTKTIRREALPVLFEATALELDICAAAVGKPDANVGPLECCIIFKHVKKINVVSVLRARQDIAVIASRVMDVIDALSSHRTIIVHRIGLSLGELDNGDADPVIRALLALKCEPDVTFGLVRPGRLWNSACVSPELAREFVQKFSNAASLCEANDGVQGSNNI